MTDVRNAINAGKEVTISQTQVHAFGWSGTGYIVLDPESGADGGFLLGVGMGGLISVAILYAAIPTTAVLLPMIWLTVAQISAIIFTIGLIEAIVNGISPRCFIEGLATGLSLMGIGTIARLTINTLSRTIAAIGLIGALSTTISGSVAPSNCPLIV